MPGAGAIHTIRFRQIDVRYTPNTGSQVFDFNPTTVD